jgi:ATP-binding cassette subfamily B protein
MPLEPGATRRLKPHSRWLPDQDTNVIRPFTPPKRLRPYLNSLYGGDVRSLVTLLIVSVLAGLSEALVLTLIASIAASMVVHEAGLHALSSYGLDLSIGVALAIALAAASVRLVLQVIIAWLPAKISADVQAAIRRDLVASFSQTSWSVQSEDREGLFQELMTSQVTQTTQVVVQVIIALSGSAMFLALIAAAFLLSPIAALVILGAATILFWSLRPLGRLGRAAGRALSHTNVLLASGVGESVRLAEDAHVLGTREAMRSRMDLLIANTRQAFFRFQLMGGLVRNTYQSLVILMIIAGLSVLYFTNVGNLAALGAVVLMLVRASSYAQQFQNGFQALNQLLPYLERIQDTTSRYRDSIASAGDHHLDRINLLAFHHVGFAYRAGTPILHDVSFDIHAGEAIGVAGPSGAGKSTLVQLLLQLRAPEVGSYYVNGELACDFRPDDWHRQFAYVAQEPRIYNATAADNIRFFRDIDDTCVEQAARLAHIHDDIINLRDGYNTTIGQLANALSGGQRQRICLARALAAQPSVLVLDEPTSALDMASETAVQASLGELHGSVTLVIVAHRLSTLANCDRVLILTDGQIEAFDPIADLPGSSAYYRSITATLANASKRNGVS